MIEMNNLSNLWINIVNILIIFNYSGINIFSW